MRTAELRNNAEIKKWFSRINASSSTKQAYFQGMQAFTEMTGKTPEELIFEAESEIRAGASYEGTDYPDISDRF